MWPRNLLFIGLCLAGALVLASSLAPSPPPEHWREVDSPAAPADDFAAAVDEVNDVFRRQWRESGLEPAPRADDLAIARRLSLALTGTIPSLEEIRMFESQPADRRIDWWTAGLLRDRRASDYVAERLARAYVGTIEGPFLLYRRRRFANWLSEQLQQNRPYDAIVGELIAGDGLWTDSPATNFITAAIKPDSDEGVQENVMASRVSRAFLGVRLDCAECHDHPFEPQWRRTDFHGLAAFFGEANVTLGGLRDRGAVYMVEDRETLERHEVQPAVPFLSELLPAEGTPRERLAAWVTHEDNVYFARATVNRYWAMLFGRALVEPVDNIPTAGDGHPALDVLARDFVAHGYDLERLVKTIAATDAYQLDSAADREITEDHEACWAAFPLTRLRPEQVAGAVEQAASLATLDHESHIFNRILRATELNDFVKQYGDTGEDEFGDHGGTIPQRLLMMNGELVRKKSGEGFLGAAGQIAKLAPTDEAAIEAAYLAVLSRRPSAEEREHFVPRIAGSNERNARLEDLVWALINSSEFAWNH